MANQDVVIPIVFPDYLITVETPPLQLKFPAIVQGKVVPDGINIPSTKQRISNLGHAGILFIDGSNGLTKYYEYGRYDREAKGLVRYRAISDVKMAKNGRPTKTSLTNTLSEIAKQSGQGGKIRGAYVELTPGSFRKMLTFSNNRMKENNNPKRAPYELLSNSCLHFMKGVAEAGGVKMPVVVLPQPVGYILQVRILEDGLDFDLAGRLTIDNIQLD